MPLCSLKGASFAKTEEFDEWFTDLDEDGKAELVAKVELLKRDGQPLGTYARHYYDLFQLAA